MNASDSKIRIFRSPINQGSLQSLKQISELRQLPKQWFMSVKFAIHPTPVDLRSVHGLTGPYCHGPLARITIKGCPVHQVEPYKLLEVHVSHDRSWNTHVEYKVTKASKRLYALRLLRKSGVVCADLVSIYCALIRLVFEYAAPAWAPLPPSLDNMIESVQRKALRIIF